MQDPRATVRPDAETPRVGVAVVVLVVFLDLVGFGIVVPILPFYVRAFAVSDVFIGLLAASYSLMQFLFAPTLGRLSDARGRKPVIAVSLVGSVLAWTLFGLADGLLLLFAARMLAGAMGGNIAAAQAYIADVTPAERRASGLGLVGAAFGLGFVFGPALGGVFASPPVLDAARSALPAAVPVTRFSLPSFAAAGFSLLSLVVTLLFLREPDRTRTAAPRTSWAGQFVDALRDARLGGLVVGFFLVSVAFSGVQVMFIPYAADVYGYAAFQTAYLLTYIGVLGVFNQGVLVGRLSRRYADTRLATAGAALLVVALATLPASRDVGRLLLPDALPGPAWVTPELGGLLLVLTLLSLGNGLLNVALSTVVSRSVDAASQGSAFGVTQGAGSLGRTVGPPLMAALYAVAVPVPFLLGAALLLPVVAIVVRLAAADRAVAPPPGE